MTHSIHPITQKCVWCRCSAAEIEHGDLCLENPEYLKMNRDDWKRKAQKAQAIFDKEREIELLMAEVKRLKEAL